MAGLNDFLGKTVTPAAPIPSSQGSLDTFLSRDPRTNVTGILGTVSNRPPEQEGLARDLAQRTGRSVDDVRGNEETVKAEVNAEEQANAAAASPILNKFLTDPNNAALAQRDLSNLNIFERIYNAGIRGSREVDFQIEQFEAIPFSATSVEQKEADAAARRLAEIGQDEGDGFFSSSLVEATTVMAGVVRDFTSPEAAVLIGGGAATGGVLGLAGGPIAPATVPAGLLTGAGVGATMTAAVRTFKREAGGSFPELVEAGLTREEAAIPAYVIGTVNAALELGSFAVISKPFIQAGKKVFRKKMMDKLLEPTNKALLKQFVKAYGTGVAIEVTTEVMQEMVQIAVLNWEAARKDGVESISMEEAGDRVAEIALKTFKAMIILGPIGPSVNFIAQKSEARQAEKNKEKLDAAHQAAQQSELKEVAPDKFGELVGEQMSAGGQPDFFVDGGVLWEWAVDNDGMSMLRNLGVAEVIGEARINGNDVRIPASRIAQHLLGTEMYETLGVHLRYKVSGMSEQEAIDFGELGLEDEQQSLNTAAIPEEIDTQLALDPVSLAEAQLGMGAMFQTAEESGMTENDFITYLANIQKKRDAASDNLKDLQLKELQRTVTAAWKKALQAEEARSRESLGQTQTYSAMLGIGRDRLDQAATLALVEELGGTLNDLPTQSKNRKIFDTKLAKGIDPETYAQLYGYRDAKEMIEDFLTAVPFEEAVQIRADEAMVEKNSNLLNTLEAVVAARELLHSDKQLTVLMAELNQLRTERGQKRANTRLLKRKAQEFIAKTPMKDATPFRFFAAARRLARDAARAIRAGDRGLAESKKFQQILNFQMAKEAIKLQKEMESKISRVRKLANPKRKATRKISVEDQQAIQHLASKYNLSRSRPKAGEEAVSAVQNTKDGPVALTEAMNVEGVTPRFWKDATVGELRDLYASVRAIHKRGLEKNKLRNKELIEGALDFEVASIVANIQAIPKKNRASTRKWYGRRLKDANEFGAWILNADSILRQTDGFKENGPTWTSIKGRHDQALNQGYQKGDIGWVNRIQKEAKILRAIFDRNYNAKAQRSLGKRVEGLDFVLNKQEQLSLILNYGNPEGRASILESNQYNEEQMADIIAALDPNDVAFINETLDFLESFWKEIRGKEESRRNYTPIKVEAIIIDTPHGQIKGGFYPLKYDRELSLFEDSRTLDEQTQTSLQGQFAASHTARWHTEERKKNVGKPLDLNLNVLNRHLNMVTWDLEMGDALHDAYRVWHAPEVRKAMEAAGYGHYWDSINLWIRDVTTGEVVAGDVLSRSARWIRTGFTISKLGFNLKTVALQPLGLVSTAVQLGKWNTFRSLHHAVKPSSWKQVSEMSAAMRARDQAFNQDMELARRAFTDGILSRWVGDKAEFIIRESAFIMLKKSQRLVDITTWMAAYNKHMGATNNDHSQAVEFADLMVARTQGSAVFGQRTAFERGSVSINSKQSELIRAFTPFMSYFIAKNNVAFERFKKTNFKSPWELVNFVTDMALLYMFEGLAIALLTTEDDDDLAFNTLQETGLGIVAGIPIARDIVGVAQGFEAGRVGNLGKDITDLVMGAAKAMDEGEYKRLRHGATNLTFQFMHIPGASQANRALDALEEGSDNPMDFIFGAKR